jgi:hypothetical protein
MARYRKKPVEVEAFLFGVDNMPDWFMDKVISKDVVLHRIPFDESRARNYGQMYCYIKTLEGTMQAYEGKDYIIKGIKGEIYPCKVDVFESTYEIPTADVVPKSEVEDYKHNWQKIHDSYNEDCLEHYNKGRQDATREIFEEIEKYKRSPMPECKPVYVINDSSFAELKKKYAEDKT